ncbi:hypothetical protein PQU92_13510 [Asticcacaulis sp. BYS171W]|uniref:Uncharacterized protein n=1 Tax=Asticcacaulis aquaticus TaxID=2984212 RepID=A0ABT5HW30_9CAUL|nr:hypothetical protein [Asticcacaulis aquaticus]MDC7684301.1 hypothetical protein [Asticcacaulis aquaticus]
MFSNDANVVPDGKNLLFIEIKVFQASVFGHVLNAEKNAAR